MYPLAVFVFLLALLPELSSAFFPYLPDGYKKARKNVHLGQEVSKGFNEALSKVSVHRRAVPVSAPGTCPYILLTICSVD